MFKVGVFAALLGVVSTTATGCASRYRLGTEPPTYAGLARIKVDVNKTGNREVDLRIDHLAPPAKIDPASRAYVVWVSVPGRGISKLGVLDYDEKRRKGRLEATTPHPKFELIVSLEQDRGVSTPGTTVVLRKIVAA